MPPSVAPNVFLVEATGMFQVRVTVQGRLITLPPVHAVTSAALQVEFLKRNKRNLAEVLAFEEHTILQQNEGDMQAAVTGHPAVRLDGGYPRASVAIGGRIYEGPKRRNIAVASRDAAFLKSSVDEVPSAVEMLLRQAPEVRGLPPGVVATRQGKFMSFVALPGKVNSYGPAVEFQTTAFANAELLRACRDTGGDVVALSKELLQEARRTRGSFVEAKGCGWQPKDFPGVPYFLSREEAFEVACLLRSADDARRAVIVDQERAKVRERDSADKLACLTSAPIGLVPRSAQKVRIICADVCVPPPELDGDRLTGKFWASLSAALEPGFVVEHVCLRDCNCAREGGLCEPFSVADRDEARRRLSHLLKNAKDSMFLVPGRAFGVLAYDLHESGVRYAAMPHPSRCVARLYAARAARAVNALVTTEAVTPRQIHQMALASRSREQVANCRKGRFGHSPASASVDVVGGDGLTAVEEDESGVDDESSVEE